MRATTYILVSLLFVASVSAIGVSPPKAQVTFTPNAEGAIDVLLQSTLDTDAATTVEIRGPLAAYITAETPNIKARGGSKAEIRWDLPADIPPGINRHQILWTESYFSETEGSMNVRTGVAFQLDIWKPYPGKYVELDVNPQHVPAGRDTEVKVAIHSRGDQAVLGELRIDLFDPEGALLDTVIQDDLAIEGDRSMDRYAQLKTASFEPGRYTVRARFDYADEVAEESATLILGEKTVRVANLTGTFYKDVATNRFEVELESMWNEPLEAVEAEMQLGTSTGRTPSMSLTPFAKKRLVGYWDTDASLEAGEHTAVVTARFRDGEPVTRSFPVRLHNHTPEPPQQEAPEEIVYIGLADVVFLLIILISVLYFIWYKSTEHRKRR